MMDELYINGVRVDMPDSGVFLDYTSGVLADLDSVSANYSYTIKLPKTATNMQVVGGLFFTTTVSEFPAVRNVATLLRDGVPIVSGATVNLLAVNEDEIELTLSWGVADVLGDVSDLSIRDLYGATEAFRWSLTEPTVALMADLRQGLYNAPTVSVGEIMGRIAAGAGGALFYDESLFEGWVVPILNRVRSSTKSNYGYLYAFRLIYNDTQTAQPVSLWIAQLYSSGVVRGTGTTAQIGDYNPCYLGFYPEASSDERSFKAQIFWRAQYDREPAGGGDPAPLVLGYWDSSVNTVFPLLEMKAVRDLSDLDNEVYIYEGSFTFSTEDGYTNDRPLCFKCDSAYYMAQRDVSASGALVLNVVDADEEDDDLAVPGDEMRYSENLPDVTCKDFVKGVCGLFGLFPVLVGDAVYLAQYTALHGRQYGSYDWSAKMLQTTDVPASMDMNADGVAQANRFIFANDDDVPETAGEVSVANVALDETTDFISVPFNGCENSKLAGGVANIPLYTLENSDDDRGQVWKFDEDDGCYVLYNNGDYLYFYRFAWMIATYNPDMDEIMAGRVITERLALDAIDLRDLDMRRVVYLAQYGAYFAIMEIKTKEEYAEVKLLTLQ